MNKNPTDLAVINILLLKELKANLASKNDIAVLVKKTDFDDKLKNLNKNATSNKKNMYLLKIN